MEVSSKMTLYDMLAMVIPGFLLLMVPVAICGNFLQLACIYDKHSFMFILIATIASYAVGLVYHWIIISIGSCFKWDKNKMKWDCESCKKTIKKWIILFFDFRNNLWRIREMKIKHNNEINKNDHNKPTKDDYYHAYYFLMEKKCLHNIPILELQVAFLKNMAPIVFLYGILIIFNYTKIHWFVKCCLCLNPYCIAIALIVLTFFLLYAMIKIQDKIYELIWEGNQYLNEINEKTEINH